MKEQFVQISRRSIRRIAMLRQKLDQPCKGKSFKHEEDLWNAEIDLVNECLRAAGFSHYGKEVA